jgi:hypothetical protein
LCVRLRGGLRRRLSLWRARAGRGISGRALLTSELSDTILLRRLKRGLRVVIKVHGLAELLNGNVDLLGRQCLADAKS